MWAQAGRNCPIAKFPLAKLRAVFVGKRVVFVGDSIVRNVFPYLARRLLTDNHPRARAALK